MDDPNEPVESSAGAPGAQKIGLTDEQLRRLEEYCKLQATFDEICSVLDIDRPTLDRLRRECPRVLAIMNRGYATGKIFLRRAMMKKAENDPKMQIFLARNILDLNPRKRDDVESTDNLSVDEMQREVAKLMFEHQDSLREAYENGLAEDTAETGEENDTS